MLNFCIKMLPVTSIINLKELKRNNMTKPVPVNSWLMISANAYRRAPSVPAFSCGMLYFAFSISAMAFSHFESM